MEVFRSLTSRCAVFEAGQTSMVVHSGKVSTEPFFESLYYSRLVRPSFGLVHALASVPRYRYLDASMLAHIKSAESDAQ